MTAPYVYHGTIIVSLSGASQGLVDLGEKYRKSVVQAHLGTNSGYLALIQPTKGGTAEVFSTASQSRFTTQLTASTTTAAFGNQPAASADTLHVVSDSTSDITQTITVYATTAAAPSTVLAYKARLNGTTAVNIGSTAPYDYQGAAAAGNFYNVLGIELSASCAGTITLQEASGNLTIKTIATEITSKGVTDVAYASQSAFGMPVRIAYNSTTKIMGIYGEAVDGTTGESMSLNSTNGQTTKCYSRVTKLLWGDAADTKTIDYGIYGILLGSGGGAVLSDKGTEGGPEEVFMNHRYLAWALYSGTTLTAGGAADRLNIMVYG